MQFIVEFNQFYKVGDIVLIEYWWSDMLTPVKIIEQISPRTFKVSHNITQSKIFNAPDEIISTGDIVDIARTSNRMSS
jgi:hypothetical protein